MTYIKFTSDFKYFSIRWENEILYFDWTTPLNLSNVETISLTNFQLFPIPSHNKGYAIRVFTNLIRGHSCNPKGEIADFFIPKSAEAIPKNSAPGDSSRTHLMRHSIPHSI